MTKILNRDNEPFPGLVWVGARFNIDVDCGADMTAVFVKNVRKLNK